jgi:hypothetical protein
LGSNGVDWIAIAAAIGKAVAGAIAKEMVVGGKARIFPGEVEKAIAAGYNAPHISDSGG